jgi:hypothetical protein
MIGQMEAGEFSMQRIVEESLMLPSLEDLDEVGHSEDLRTILLVMSD